MQPGLLTVNCLGIKLSIVFNALLKVKSESILITRLVTYDETNNTPPPPSLPSNKLFWAFKTTEALIQAMLIWKIKTVEIDNTVRSRGNVVPVAPFERTAVVVNDLSSDLISKH